MCDIQLAVGQVLEHPYQLTFIFETSLVLTDIRVQIEGEPSWAKIDRVPLVRRLESIIQKILFDQNLTGPFRCLTKQSNTYYKESFPT